MPHFTVYESCCESRWLLRSYHIVRTRPCPLTSSRSCRSKKLVISTITITIFVGVLPYHTAALLCFWVDSLLCLVYSFPSMSPFAKFTSTSSSLTPTSLLDIYANGCRRGSSTLNQPASGGAACPGHLLAPTVSPPMTPNTTPRPLVHKLNSNNNAPSLPGLPKV